MGDWTSPDRLFSGAVSEIVAQLRFPVLGPLTPSVLAEGNKVTIKVVPKYLPPTIGFTGIDLTPNWVWTDSDRTWGGNEATGDPMGGQYGFLDYTRDFTWVYKMEVRAYYPDEGMGQAVVTTMEVDLDEEGPGWPDLYSKWEDSYGAEPWMTYTKEYVIWNWYDTAAAVALDSGYAVITDDAWTLEYMENLLLYGISINPLKPDPRGSGWGDKLLPRRTGVDDVFAADSGAGERFRTLYDWPGDDHAVINDLRKRFKLIAGYGDIQGQKTVMDEWLNEQYGVIAASLYYSIVPKQFTAKMQKALPISESGLSAMVAYNNDPYMPAAAHAGFEGDPTTGALPDMLLVEGAPEAIVDPTVSVELGEGTY